MAKEEASKAKRSTVEKEAGKADEGAPQACTGSGTPPKYWKHLHEKGGAKPDYSAGT